eukprot:scaffold3725_cov129-Isochrysis_galbana.AAC.4
MAAAEPSPSTTRSCRSRRTVRRSPPTPVLSVITLSRIRKPIKLPLPKTNHDMITSARALISPDEKAASFSDPSDAMKPRRRASTTSTGRRLFLLCASASNTMLTATGLSSSSSKSCTVRPRPLASASSRNLSFWAFWRRATRST